MEHKVVVASSEVGCSSTGHSSFNGSPLCTLVIPNALLLQLHDTGSGYVKGVNACITGKMVTLDTSCSRLQLGLQKTAGRVFSKWKSCKGSRDRVKLKVGSTNFMVGEGEIVSVESVQKELGRAEVRCVCVCVRVCVCSKYLQYM